MTENKTYLTEQKLGEYLKVIFPNNEFVHNKQVPNSGIKNRPDYRCDELKIIIEYDGHRHYTQSKVGLKDLEVGEIWRNIGYRVIRIPYFIQLSSEVIDDLFKIDIEWEQVYEHGFIDDCCVLPADFCTVGLTRFHFDLQQFEYIEHDIIESLKNKIKQGLRKYEVVPINYGFDFIDKHGIILDSDNKYIINDGYITMKYEDVPCIDYVHDMINDTNQHFCGGWSMGGVDTSDDALFIRVIDGLKPMGIIYGDEEKLTKYINRLPNGFDYEIYNAKYGNQKCLVFGSDKSISEVFDLESIFDEYVSHLNMEIDVFGICNKKFKEFFTNYDDVDAWLTGLLLGYPIENTISLYRMGGA